MGTNNFNNKVQAGNELKASDINQFQDALNETVVGRQDGIPTRGKNLGSIPTPWGTVYTEGLNVQGDDVDLSSLSRERYSIVSGATGSGNSVAQFIQGINNQTGQFRILGDGTDLVLTINGRRVVIDQDIDFTIPFDVPLNFGINITGAVRPGGSNTYQNSFAHDFFEDGHIGKNAGNKDVVYSNESRLFSGVLPVSLVDLTGGDATQRILIDQFKAQRESFFNNGLLWLFSIGNPASPNSTNQAHREYFLARGFKSGSVYFLVDIKRRYILLSGNASGNSFNILQIANSTASRPFRDVFDTGTASNRYGLTRHELYWVFIDADSPTNVITTKNEPVYARSTDARVDYSTAWFDTEKNQWNFRTSIGQAFVKKDMIPIGIVSNGYKTQSNGTGTLLARSFDFTRKYEKTNTIRLIQRGNNIESKEERNIVSVYGTNVKTKSKIKIPIPDGLPNGTAIYLYITDQGVSTIEENISPVYREELQGYYHQTRSWRCIGQHIVGNIDRGMSYRYSNNEKYRYSYSLRIAANGEATQSKNDVFVEPFKKDYEFLNNIFYFERPIRGTSNTVNYHWISFNMRKNNLFREYGDLIRNSDIKNREFININNLVGYDTGVSLFKINDIQGFLVRAITLVSGSTSPGNQSYLRPSITSIKSDTRFRIDFTINRYGTDLLEKTIWNELS